MKLDELVLRARPVLEAAPDALCILDGSGALAFSNRAYDHMKHRSRAEMTSDAAPIELDGAQVGTIIIYHDVSEVSRLRQELERMDQKLRSVQEKYGFQDIVGRDPVLLQTIKVAKSVAPTPASILIRGESGTGKELFAQAIHNHSSRSRGKMVKVNCSALSEELLESELFGYLPGAFTGASRSGKTGLIEAAHRGTLFLDEVGDISPRTQTRLLRVLQEKEVLPVGGTEPVRVDVRVISATHRDLESMVARGEFREDLYYRLNVFPLYLPALRERPGDIEAVALYLIRRYNDLYHRRVEGLEPGAAELLCAQPWNGNVRELENAVTRLLIGVPGDRLLLTREDVAAVLPAVQTKAAHAPAPLAGGGPTLAESVAQAERGCIRAALHRCGGDKNRAACELGLPLRTLYYKCKRLGL